MARRAGRDAVAVICRSCAVAAGRRRARLCAHCPDPIGSSPLNNRSTQRSRAMRITLPLTMAPLPIAAAGRPRGVPHSQRDLLKVQRELKYLQSEAASFWAISPERRCGGYITLPAEE